MFRLLFLIVFASINLIGQDQNFKNFIPFGMSVSTNYRILMTTPTINLKYAHIEREFRWLLRKPVDFGVPEMVMEIHDKYIDETNPRLRK